MARSVNRLLQGLALTALVIVIAKRTATPVIIKQSPASQTARLRTALENRVNVA